MFPFGRDLLAIYLQDHLAAATTGVELARRARGSNEGTEYGDFLGQLERDITEDREALRAVMTRLEVSEDRAKIAAGWAAEKTGRLKLNGRLTGYSPLSRVVELEALMAGVTGKLAGWRALRRLAEHDERLDPVELDRLIARAERQLSSLAEHHRSAADEALTAQR
jgi:hypothetical protein